MPLSDWNSWPTGRCGGNAPLTFLITAIGMSFVIQEFVHFILPQIIHGYGGNNAQQPIILVQPKVQFTVLHANVTNVTLVVIITAALVFALLTDVVINRTRSAAASGRSPRIPPRRR